MRLATTTSNGRAPGSGSSPGRRGSAGRGGFGGRSRRVASTAIGSVSTPATVAAPACAAAIARMPEPQPTSRTLAPARPPVAAKRSRAARHSRVVGCRPVPKAIPGSSARTTSPGCRRCRRHVGRMTSRRPAAGPGSAPSRPPPSRPRRPRRVRSIADRAQAECLEVPERGRDLVLRSLRRRGVAGRHVGPDDRRPGRVKTSRESFLDELEGRLDARTARGHPAEDLTDCLDGLHVGLDRELQPGRRRRRVCRPRRPARQPSASRTLSRMPALPSVTISPAASA